MCWAVGDAGVGAGSAPYVAHDLSWLRCSPSRGGNAVNVGPYDPTSKITPSTTTRPDYMAHISLPYYPNSAPLSIVSSGWFLSMTPATLSETASGSSYSDFGSFITGWTLQDANFNPISLATAGKLFGVPVVNQVPARRPFNGVDLTPIDPQQLIVG